MGEPRYDLEIGERVYIVEKIDGVETARAERKTLKDQMRWIKERKREAGRAALQETKP